MVVMFSISYVANSSRPSNVVNCTQVAHSCSWSTSFRAIAIWDLISSYLRLIVAYSYETQRFPLNISIKFPLNDILEAVVTVSFTFSNLLPYFRRYKRWRDRHCERSMHCWSLVQCFIRRILTTLWVTARVRLKWCHAHCLCSPSIFSFSRRFTTIGRIPSRVDLIRSYSICKPHDIPWAPMVPDTKLRLYRGIMSNKALYDH
jgi:hypothetical protein